MKQRRVTSKRPEKTMDLSNLIGKPVYASDGTRAGSVKSLHVDPMTFSFQGVGLDRGVFGPREYIGRDYIESLFEDRVVLNTLPVEDLIGKKVVDKTGDTIGKVKEVTTIGDTNELLSLVVNPGIGTDEMIVPQDQIRSVGEHVLLSVEV